MKFVPVAALRTRLPWVTSVGTAVVLALGVLLPSAQVAHASSDTKVFDSTNTPNQVSGFGVSVGTWFAFTLTAFSSTTVNAIDVYLPSAPDAGAFVQIGTGYATGSLGVFSPTAVEPGLTCAGRACARVTFTGTAQLTGGNDYWLWIGTNGPSTLGWDSFDGAAATSPGLALGSTFGTNDIRASDGTPFDSSTAGFPWVRMFGPSSGEAQSPSPGTVQISLGAPEGAQCGSASVSGLNGTWLQLPTTFECRPPSASATAGLLGWATSSHFPVVLAQRQVDNGWGAYETFDEAGRLTGVFIPVGGFTLLSNDTALYPIFSP